MTEVICLPAGSDVPRDAGSVVIYSNDIPDADDTGIDEIEDSLTMQIIDGDLLMPQQKIHCDKIHLEFFVEKMNDAGKSPIYIVGFEVTR